MPSILVVLSAYNEASHMHGLCGDGVNGVDGADAVSGAVSYTHLTLPTILRV